MSEKRFKVCIDSNNGVGLFDNSVKLLFVKFTNKEDALSCKDSLKHHCNLMNELYNENEQLKKSEKINMEYAEQIVKENQKLRIAKNDLRFKKMALQDENEQLKQKLENLGLNEKNDMVEYSIEDFFRWLQRIKKEFEDFEDNGD